MMADLRVLMLTHYYPPEVGAPQTRLHETAIGLQRMGIAVRILTGPPHYPSGTVRSGYRMLELRRERLDGIQVTRLPMVARPNSGLLDRSIDQGSFALAAMAAIPDIRWSNVLLVESPPLFLGLTAAFHRIVSHRPYIFHVADPWPDFPIAMGALRSPIARRLAYANEHLAYRFAASITTVTPALVASLERKRGARGKVHLLPNGVDLGRFQPDLDPTEARRALGWREARLTLVYAGTVGLAQGLGTLIDAMSQLRDDGIDLHIVGDGAEKQEIAGRIQRHGLDHVQLHPSVPAADVPRMLAAADAGLVLLKAGPLYEQALPTKLVEGLAAGRPLIVSADGEAARIVREADAGVVARAEDSTGLADAMRRVRDDPERAAHGRRALVVAEAQYDRRKIVARLAALLSDAAQSGPSPSTR
jgi:glycosyltransferase involved in cell wall biosynthesis